jgi:CHRD domain
MKNQEKPTMLSPFTLALISGALLLLTLGACQMVTPGAAPDPLKAGMNEISFTATEYSFSGPPTIPGGLTRVELSNEGKQQHDLLLFRLDEGKTLQDIIAGFQAAAAAGVEATPPPWVKLYGGIAGVRPGERRSYVIDLLPGNYAMLSFGEFLKTRSGIPDLAQGMMRTVTVTAARATTATPPTPDVTVAMHDFSFTLSEPITAGEQVIEVTNVGDELHEFFIYRLHPGAKLADFMTFFNGGAPATDAPPAEFFGGVMLLDRGFSATFTLDFAPGVYVLVCFHPSAAHEGQSHLALGMVQAITVGTAATTTTGIQTLTIPLDGTSKGASGPPSDQDPDGSGTATLRFDAEKGEICWDLAVKDIAPAFASHIHKNYGLQIFSLSPPTDGASSGCDITSRSIITAILTNPAEYFVIVHNNEFPTSALSGRLAQ